ncbi:MAG: amino acid permease, partial [Candidatus Caenarcaniphilales bacterium]|nr:amino acid permease [Candidatus Caenarcaniphilales bacterium]
MNLPTDKQTNLANNLKEENAHPIVEDKHSLKKQLTVFDAVCMVVGSVVGSGIFVSPTRVFDLLYKSPFVSLSAWVVAALVSLAGALCYAELGCLFPKAGAEYQYLKNGIGRFWGFIFAWAQLIVLGTGSIAIMAIISANYLVEAIAPGSSSVDLYTRIAASLLVVLLTIANSFGVKSGSLVQNLLTIAKVLGVVFLLGLGVFFFSKLNLSNLSNLGSLPASNDNFVTLSFKYGSAMIACLWAFDGWNNLSRVTEEAVDVPKTLPVGLIMGILIVTVIYLCLNCFYFSVLSPEQIAQSKAIAISAVNELSKSSPFLQSLGVFVLIGLLISLSAGGATNGSLLSGARIYFAAARDGLFFKWFASLSEKSKSPIASLSIQGAWAIGLIWIGKNFETLLDYFSFSAWLFYAACAAILIYLRITKPNLPRPYKVLLYPITPIIFFVA